MLFLDTPIWGKEINQINKYPYFYTQITVVITIAYLLLTNAWDDDPASKIYLLLTLPMLTPYLWWHFAGKQQFPKGSCEYKNLKTDTDYASLLVAAPIVIAVITIILNTWMDGYMGKDMVDMLYAIPHATAEDNFILVMNLLTTITFSFSIAIYPFINGIMCLNKQYEGSKYVLTAVIFVAVELLIK